MYKAFDSAKIAKSEQCPIGRPGKHFSANNSDITHSILTKFSRDGENIFPVNMNSVRWPYLSTSGLQNFLKLKFSKIHNSTLGRGREGVKISKLSQIFPGSRRQLPNRIVSEDSTQLGDQNPGLLP